MIKLGSCCHTDQRGTPSGSSACMLAPVTDILVSAANLKIDIVGRGADLVTVIIVSMITPTTEIATSQDP